VAHLCTDPGVLGTLFSYGLETVPRNRLRIVRVWPTDRAFRGELYRHTTLDGTADPVRVAPLLNDYSLGGECFS
jgi:hypothetical protein